MTADPLERFVCDAVLDRLDTPEMADVLAGRSSADERTQELTRALDDANEQLEELSLAYANRDVTMREWMTAKKPITGRLDAAQCQLAQVTHTTALTGLVGNGEELSSAWGTLNLSRQLAIVGAVIDHITIGPGTPGARSLDLGRISITWQH